MMTETYVKSKFEILTYLMQFATGKLFSDGTTWVSRDCCFKNDYNPPIGSLVTPTSTPSGHKWYLGWLREIEVFSGGNVYHIQSLEDGQICKWSNVGMMFFSPETVEKFPSWKWTDRQHKFNGQWNRACYKSRDAYILRPNQCEFYPDGSVKVSLRFMFNRGEPPPVKVFPDFKRVKVRDLLAYYDECVAWKEEKKDHALTTPQGNERE